MGLFRKAIVTEESIKLEQVMVAPKERWEFLKYLGPAFVASVA